MRAFQQLFRGRAREAWSHKNLEPMHEEYVPPHSRFGTRANYKLLDVVMKGRVTLGVMEIQQKQFEQMVKFKSNPKNTTATP